MRANMLHFSEPNPGVVDYKNTLWPLTHKSHVVFSYDKPGVAAPGGTLLAPLPVGSEAPAEEKDGRPSPPL